MSRTRIVKGKITEIIEKDYNMYSESNIVDNAAEIISDKGEAKGESYGNPEKPSAGEITAECMVQFRPHANWSGEYGFDWIRVADTGQSGDKKWYKSIIGKYVDKIGADGLRDNCNDKFVNLGSKYDLLVNEFKKYTVPWKMSGKYPYYYIIPYLSLLPKHKAVLNLKVEVVVEPESFELKFDKNYLDVKFKNPLSVTSGEREIQNGLEIYCKKEFDSDQIIEIMAVKGEKSDSVGQLIIVKNGEQFRRKIKVTFVKVYKGREAVSISGESEYLKKFLRQSYIDATIQSTKMQILPQLDIGKYLLSDPDGTFTYLNKMLRNSYNSNGKKNNNFFDDSFRIFYVSDICETDVCAGGYYVGMSEKLPADVIKGGVKKSSMIIFNLGLVAEVTKSSPVINECTAVHELLHSIGVSHTFDSHSKYVFEEGQTDNLMDYYSKKTKLIAKQTYKWQWDLLKKQLK